MSDQFDPDAYLESNGAVAKDRSSPINKVDQTQISQFNPDAYINEAQSKEEQALAPYATPGQQAIAGLESAASAATLGTSRHLENITGITTPEDQALREKANPWTSGFGGVAGTGALLAVTGGLAAPVEAGIAGTVGATALEGAFLGAGAANADLAMGDPSLNAQKIASYVGVGALLGGGFGVLGKAAEAAAPYVGNKLSALGKAVKKVYGGAEAEGESSASSEVGAIVDAPPEAKTGVQETSIKDIQDRVNQAKYAGNALEMPEKIQLEDSLNRVEMSNPVHPLQLESLSNQRARDAYQTAKEMGDSGKALQAYESLQKNELVNKTGSTIQDIAGEATPTADAVQGGNQASKYFTDQYQAEKKAAGELVGQAKELNTQGVDHLHGVVNAMSEAVPQIGKMIDASGNEIKILPYKTSMGMSKQTYGAVKDAVDSLKENPQSFSDLFSIRKGLENGVNMFTSDAATQSEIRSLKASMMDYMQNIANNTSFRDAFKRYAVNEAERGVIEKVFGASVGSPEFGAISKIKPEVIGDRIFSNTANVHAAKNILPKEQFNHVLANWISEAKAAATDKGAFSSNKFGTFLKKNQDSLNVAFSDNPQALQRLKDLTTIMRILPDSPSINPSGTAKTIFAALKEHFGDVKGPSEAAVKAFTFLKEHTLDKIKDQIATQNLNEQLAGRAASHTVASEVQRIIQKTTDKISSGAKAIFGTTPGNISKGSVIPLGVDHYEKNVKRLKELNNDQTSMFNHLENTSQILYGAVPNISQGIQSTMINTVQFLNSKLPKPINELPFAQDWEPTNSQKDKFNRYFAAVDDPLIALKQIKQGSLTNETMEALTAVHPDLLQEMQHKVMENMNPKKKDINYSTQISLSKFLGQPMNNGMIPSVIASNQATFAMPQQQPQQNMRGKKSSLGGLKHLGVSKRAETETQQLEEDQV